MLLFRNFRPRQTIIHFVSNDLICFIFYHILNQSVKRLFERTIIKISTTYQTEYQNIKKHQQAPVVSTVKVGEKTEPMKGKWHKSPIPWFRRDSWGLGRISLADKLNFKPTRTILRHVRVVPLVPSRTVCPIHNADDYGPVMCTQETIPPKCSTLWSNMFMSFSCMILDTLIYNSDFWLCLFLAIASGCLCIGVITITNSVH